MTHAAFPRALSSAIGDVQAKVERGQRKPAAPDPRWRIRDDLVRALRFYEIGPKHTAVLSALLSFMRHRTPIVFASNRTLSTRLLGMAERTLRRHVARLVEKGFLRRVDSPNRKRWARRGAEGELEAFGLDLSPLFERASEFADRAAAAMRQDEEMAEARLRLSVLRERLKAQDIAPELMEEIRRDRERSPCPDRLQHLAMRARAALGESGEEPPHTLQPHSGNHGLAGNGGQSGRHQQTRNDRVYSSSSLFHGKAVDRPRTDSLGGGSPASIGAPVSNLGNDCCSEWERGAPAPSRGSAPAESTKDFAARVLAELTGKLRAQTKPGSRTGLRQESADEVERGQPPLSGGTPAALPPSRRDATRGLSADGPARNQAHRDLIADEPSLDEVLASCPEALALAGDRPRSWSDLFEAAWRIGRSLRITESLLGECCGCLGRAGFAVTIFGLCERHDTIQHPAAYLKALCARPDFQPREMLRGSKRNEARP